MLQSVCITRQKVSVFERTSRTILRRSLGALFSAALVHVNRKETTMAALDIPRTTSARLSASD